jgi:uncharacterized protein (DUF1778 family)
MKERTLIQMKVTPDFKMQLQQLAAMEHKTLSGLMVHIAHEYTVKRGLYDNKSFMSHDNPI